MAVSRWLVPVTIGIWAAAFPVQWASGQGQSPKEGEQAQAQAQTGQSNYNRAYGACMGGRGYQVR